MPSSINLRRKIKSITNTKQITRAMQMVAASKMRRAQEAVLGTRAYAEMSQRLTGRLQSYVAKQESITPQPLWQVRSVKRAGLIVISSNRGLAGGYNSNILRQTLDWLDIQPAKQAQVITIGRKIQEALNRLNIPILASFTDFPDRPTSRDILPVIKLATEAFLKQEIDQVTVIYTHFHSTLKQIARATILLPIQSKTDLESEPVDLSTALFEPNPTAILDYIGPRFLETQLLQAMLDSAAAEHSARMLAMKNATDNATDLIDDLRLTYNSLRQATITREIAEISAGAS